MLLALIGIFLFYYPPVGATDLPSDLQTLEYVEVIVS